MQGLTVEVSGLIKSQGGDMREFCSYLEWAWVTSVPLQDQLKWDRIRRDNCHTYQSSYVNALRQFEEDHSFLIATEYMIKIRDHLSVAAGITSYSDTKHGQMHKKVLRGEHINGDPLPNVFNAYTALTPDHLYMFAFATLNTEELEKATLGFRVLPEASTLVWELDS